MVYKLYHLIFRDPPTSHMCLPFFSQGCLDQDHPAHLSPRPESVPPLRSRQSIQKSAERFISFQIIARRGRERATSKVQRPHLSLYSFSIFLFVPVCPRPALWRWRWRKITLSCFEEGRERVVSASLSPGFSFVQHLRVFFRPQY